jgi:hypothetical protein
MVDELAVGEPHGNSLASTRTTYLYRLSDLEGNYLKTGISNDPFHRYGPAIRGTTDMEVLTGGPRAEIYSLERYIVSIDPGPWNFEPWAGSLAEDGGGEGGGGE